MFNFPTKYDVAVVGSGHAGIEAALAAARLGCRTLMITQNLDTIGQMSCNPAIGGLSKGHIVREIDALGGAMGSVADLTGIQFRLLNRTKGPSARAPRAQCDKKAYQLSMKTLVERTPKLDIKQGTVRKIVVEKGRAAGVELDLGVSIAARSVVITAGTFLQGLLFVGENSNAGGRMADASSNLSEELRSLGFKTDRFKTGTPCRVNARSINFDACEIQRGDDPAPRFSFLHQRQTFHSQGFHVEQVPCWITRTTPRTHEIIRDNLHRSPLYAGRIQGKGPRYCPSIEDKVARFTGKESHQIFLEPEGRNSNEFYINGISTSLPYDVQLDFLHSMPGLEQGEIMRAGYAVEYDYFPPTQLGPTLETKLVPGLYFAGQINGTSGYEEAAGQGLMAGANAALNVQGRPPFILHRSDAYIGVLVDDLITKGTDEPYRMFTSRAEARIQLRHDTADQRLSKLAFQAGLIDRDRWIDFEAKLGKLAVIRNVVETTLVDGVPLSQHFRRPTFHLSSLPREIATLAPLEIWELVESELKCQGYSDRQTEQNRRFAAQAGQPIPEGIDFAQVSGLRSETRQKLRTQRPGTLNQAAQISGITPVDVAILSIWLKGNGLNVP